MKEKIINRWEDLLSVIIELEIVSKNRQITFFDSTDVLENIQQWKEIEKSLFQNMTNWLEEEFGVKIRIDQINSEYLRLDVIKSMIQEILNEVIRGKIPYRGKRTLVNHISTNLVLVCYIVLTFIKQKRYKEALYWARILEETKKKKGINSDEIVLNCKNKCLSILNVLIDEIEKELLERNLILYDLILFKLYPREGKLRTEEYYKKFADIYPELLELKLIFTIV